MRNKKRDAEPIIRKALIMLILCVSITGLSAYLMRLGLSKWSYLTIKDSEVTGTISINPNIIHMALSDFKGENLYLIPDEMIAQKVLQLPRVKDVRIGRKFPSTLKVRIQERIPIGHVSTLHDENYVIDEDGVLLDIVNDPKALDLPGFLNISINYLTLGDTIADKNFQTLLQVYHKVKESYPDFLTKIKDFYIDNDDVILTDQKRGVRFIVGNKDFDERLEKLVFAYQNFGVATYSEIDVRFSDPVNELVILR